MPATEQTWRDQMRMHVIFGVSSLVMLGGTIWLLAKDHNREWRQWQLADRERVRWTVEAMLTQTRAESQAKRDQLESDLAAARSAKVDAALVAQFENLVRAEDERLAEEGGRALPGDGQFGILRESMAELEVSDAGSEAAVSARGRLLRAMDPFVREARRRENEVTTRRKFRAAEQTAIVSARGIAIGEGRSTGEIDARIDELAAEIAELDAQVADSLEYRRALETIVGEIQADEIEIDRQIAAIDAEISRLEESLAENTSNVFERVARGPILDALYTGDIKLDQIWLPDMKINYNFSSVARYDRCINCHRAIDKTAPGSAVDPAYPTIPNNERVRLIELTTPETPPETEVAGETASEPTLASVYGLLIAPRGQVDHNAVTVQVVFPESLAALAGLEMGDVIEEVNGGGIYSEADLRHYLLDVVNWGEPLSLRVRRGLDHPFTSHPRLDLFVGPTSPHKKGEMGCTICHDGQGSASDFKWASHTPNNPNQGVEWAREHGWFDNHHWIFPMTPQRFLESNCLKCHHEVTELEPSERFPDPPAPKLVEGYHLVREFGCYGCHEINGYDGPDRRIGPDLRIEPNFYETAIQILQDPGLSDEERHWAETVIERPENQSARDRLLRSINEDAVLASAPPAADAADDEATAQGEAAGPRLQKATHVLADGLKSVEAPGSLRRVGPSLRHLDSKVDFEWLYSWIREPADFRPSTKMPQFFGHMDHLNGRDAEFTIIGTDGEERQVTDREYTERFEQIEIHALSEFLLANSQPFTYLDQPAGVTEQPSAERGRWMFESRGCLACHSHAEFPGIASDQGPDLSRIAAKFNTEKGARWLYSWLKAPHRYHSRTVMPDLYLEPIQEVDGAGTPTGRVTDPAADVVSFLLGVPTEWQPEVAKQRALSAEEEQALEELTAMWLRASFPRRRADRFAKEGIPERLAATVKVDEQELVGMTDEDRVERQLRYVARRSLSRYGCFGCHDIPGYEGAKPIGTPLANWGRKDPSQLAFENVGQFLATHGIDGEQEPHGDDGGHGGHGLDPASFDADTGYYLQSLNSHQRQGFLWQKLRMPRSYDYETTRNKRYDERLRMPKFPLTDEQRESVMTFVLGLTSEAPAERYIYKPNRRQEAIVQGRHVLNKYNCAGCHILDMERWDIAFEPDWFGEPPTTNDYPFLAPPVTGEQIASSLRPDRRGLLHAQIHGMPTRDVETGAPSLVDEDSVPLEPDDTESDPYYEFSLYNYAVLSGSPWLVGMQNLLIPAARDGSGPARGKAYPSVGGDLAKYLYPRVIADERQTNPQAIPTEAWGWLPPPLHHEGEKVQTDWLHDFLMDPHAIRPAVVMRMPNFRMSSEEAARLVDYFAAKSNVEFPYEYNDRRRGGYLARSEQAHPNLFDDAMKIVTDGNYCVKCHSVGDYEVRGAVKTLGPDLDQVYRRLRPEYMRRWIANPQRILPYTGMPVNIPYDPNAPNFGGVNQNLFPGTSTAQLDGLVDLLMNFDEYTKRQTSVRELVTEPPAATDPPAQAADQPAEPRDDQAARN